MEKRVETVAEGTARMERIQVTKRVQRSLIMRVSIFILAHTVFHSTFPPFFPPSLPFSLPPSLPPSLLFHLPYMLFPPSFLLPYPGDELLMDSKETTPTKPKSTARKEIVFCEATKQMMIRKLPPVLTLHLKRFLQDGRRLRKNGRHISFPTVLNLSPFCTTDCQVSSSQPR